MPRRMIDIPLPANNNRVDTHHGVVRVERDSGCVMLTVEAEDRGEPVATFAYLNASEARAVASWLLAFAIERETFDTGRAA